MKTFSVITKDGSEVMVMKEASAVTAACSCPAFRAGILCDHIVLVIRGQEPEKYLTKGSMETDFELYEALPDSLRDLAAEVVDNKEHIEEVRKELEASAKKLRKRLGFQG